MKRRERDLVPGFHRRSRVNHLYCFLALVLTTVVALACCGRAALGATSSTEDFESGAPGWTTNGGVWQIGQPTYGPARAHSGTNCAATILNGNYPAGANARLISPSFLVPPAADHPRLRFWQWYVMSASDPGRVEVRVVGTTNWVVISPNYYNYGDVWSRTSLDLSPYAGQQIEVAFHLTSSTGGYQGWYVDDVA
ncbi:MAG TPA: choice-of-anchor J domain-containing protein, partial [Candidatus Saccharimonadales bacterium]|nr:choice-of-anchor J domain-containing protein [Candidatus Saccharimonadales bacterium]